jgi:uncharacterized protein YigE (DUF2233 family)
MWRAEARRGLAAALALICAPAMVSALDCSQTRFEEVSYTVCKVDPSQSDLRVFLREAETGRMLGNFRRVNEQLRARGETLLFAMNAGMYHPDRSPVGHYVEDGKEITPVVTAGSAGNFGLLPNGIFCIREQRADVLETRRFLREAPECRHATQSGPMLVIDGDLHPRFLAHSTTEFIRNGVGTSNDGRKVWFVIADTGVNFHGFGRFFRDHLGADQALYLDGNRSRLYAPDLRRNDPGLPMGPIVGVAAKAD